MSRESWGAVKLAGGAAIVAAATLAVLAGITWVPAAAAAVFIVFALVREPPQGAGEWLLLCALAFALALLAVVVASLGTP
jgi:hypothetical protein